MPCRVLRLEATLGETASELGDFAQAAGAFFSVFGALPAGHSQGLPGSETGKNPGELVPPPAERPLRRATMPNLRVWPGKMIGRGAALDLPVLGPCPAGDLCACRILGRSFASLLPSRTGGPVLRRCVRRRTWDAPTCAAMAQQAGRNTATAPSARLRATEEVCAAGAWPPRPVRCMPNSGRRTESPRPLVSNGTRSCPNGEPRAQAASAHAHQGPVAPNAQVRGGRLWQPGRALRTTPPAGKTVRNQRAKAAALPAGRAKARGDKRGRTLRRGDVPGHRHRTRSPDRQDHRHGTNEAGIPVSR